MIAVMSQPIIAHLLPLVERERTLPQGGILFHRGDRIGALHIVLDGTIDLVRHQENGRPVVLQHADPGAVLAEASFFADRYHCDAVATTPARTGAVPINRLRALFRDDPVFAEAWGRHLATEVQRARLRSEILALRTVAERLDAWLLWHDQTMPEKGGWKSVAEQIAVSPEALYRELARRRQE